MWDVSNTTTWITGNHTLNFGANYRRWWLQRDLANDFLGNFGGFNIGFTGSYVRGLPARLLRVERGQRLPARAFPRRGRGGQPPRVQLHVLRPVHPGRLEGQLQAHLEPGPPLRLPQRALRDERPHGLAEPRLRAGWPAGGGRDAGARGDRRRRLLPGSRPPQPRRTPTGTRSSLRGSASRTARASPGTRSSGAATGSSTTPPSCARSTAPRTSIRTSAAEATSRPSARRRRCRRRTSSSRASPAAEWRRPRCNTFLAVNQSPEPKNPYVQQWSLGVQRADHQVDQRGAELRRQPRGQPPDADQHRPGPALHGRTTRPWPSASRTPTSASTSTATGAVGRTTTP